MKITAVTALTASQKKSKILGIVLEDMITCSDLHIENPENVQVLKFLALSISTATPQKIE